MNKIKLQEGEEQLKKVLLMMKYDLSKTLDENKKFINERDAVIGKNGDLDSLKSLFDNLKIKSEFIQGDKHPRKNIIYARFSNYKILTISTNLGTFDFYQFKPDGYWNEQNWVNQTKDNKTRIGTFDVSSEKLFMKEWDTPKQDWGKDENFNEIIRISDLKQLTQKSSCPPGKKSDGKGGCIEDKSKVNISCPVGNTIGEIKKFQDWLDQNVSGWHDKYGTLKQDVSKGYGVCGPRTRKWWNEKQSEYKKSQVTPAIPKPEQPTQELPKPEELPLADNEF